MEIVIFSRFFDATRQVELDIKQWFVLKDAEQNQQVKKSLEVIERACLYELKKTIAQRARQLDAAQRLELLQSLEPFRDKELPAIVKMFGDVAVANYTKEEFDWLEAEYYFTKDDMKERGIVPFRAEGVSLTEVEEMLLFEVGKDIVTENTRIDDPLVTREARLVLSNTIEAQLTREIKIVSRDIDEKRRNPIRTAILTVISIQHKEERRQHPSNLENEIEQLYSNAENEMKGQDITIDAIPDLLGLIGFEKQQYLRIQKATDGFTIRGHGDVLQESHNIEKVTWDDREVLLKAMHLRNEQDKQQYFDVSKRVVAILRDLMGIESVDELLKLQGHGGKEALRGQMEEALRVTQDDYVKMMRDVVKIAVYPGDESPYLRPLLSPEMLVMRRFYLQGDALLNSPVNNRPLIDTLNIEQSDDEAKRLAYNEMITDWFFTTTHAEVFLEDPGLIIDDRIDPKKSHHVLMFFPLC